MLTLGAGDRYQVKSLDKSIRHTTLYEADMKAHMRIEPYLVEYEYTPDDPGDRDNPPMPHEIEVMDIMDSDGKSCAPKCDPRALELFAALIAEKIKADRENHEQG